jgi:epoxyqueuosine reductase QueG
MGMSFADKNADMVREIIENFVTTSPENRLGGPFGDEDAWAKPVIAFCRGDDPVFDLFREAVGKDQWTPLEIFSRSFPDLSVEPGELAVISWILPQTERTKQDQRKEKQYPCHRWVRSRMFGEQFNDLVRKEVVRELSDKGFEAVAPVLDRKWTRVDSEKYVYSSTWSERHMAYACGLGTFGLCDAMITPVGKAVRFGSVVARIALPGAERFNETYYDNCPFLKKQKCGACITRCPAGAISDKGHDKIKCREYTRNVVAPYVKEQWGLEGYTGCGLCQVGIPCESGIPKM